MTHYIGELNLRYHRAVIGFRPKALQQLLAYEWPGNVRELRNVLEGAYAELPNAPVRFLDMPSTLRDRVLDTPPILHTERDRLVAVLTQANWNKSRAAEQLQWSRMTLYRKLAKYALREPA
jgi:transcriptional regulator of acetoin/glycerol metabolism